MIQNPTCVKITRSIFMNKKGRLYRAGTGYTVLPAILPAVEGIILRMLRALKKNLYKKPKKAEKKSCLSEGSNSGIRTHKQYL